MDKIILILCGVLLIEVDITKSVVWDRMPCAKDPDQSISDGTVADIGRFPWLGIVQHNFYIGGATHFAITMGVLIHPSYVIAPAEDISRILRDQILNNTKFIVWYSKSVKYAIDVVEYILHPEYEERGTLATIALVEINNRGETTFGENKEAVLPICLPISGVEFPSKEMFAVKMTDEYGELQKEAYKMEYVNDAECSDFYLQNHLTLPKMTPVSALCARTQRQMPPCIWDSGTVLFTKQTWGLWKILGLSIRGPGCGAPARFLVFSDYLSWITNIISYPVSEEDEDGLGSDEAIIGFRRLSPIKIIMYNVDKVLPKDIGNCDRKTRGSVMYKDAFEVTATCDFGQGFFYVMVHQLAQFNCAVINYEKVSGKSNVAIWVEHYCQREITGIAHGQKKPKHEWKRECFAYFKSTAYVKFKFFFSFKAEIEITLYGTPEIPRIIPDPWAVKETTDYWFPTPNKQKIRYDSFEPNWNIWSLWNL